MEQFIQQLVNGIMVGSTYAVVALGFGLVFSVMRVVNLAHPEIFMVGAYVAFVVITMLHVQVEGLGVLTGVAIFLAVLLAAMLATGVAGVVLGRLVIPPPPGPSSLVPFLTTARVSLVLQNA